MSSARPSSALGSGPIPYHCQCHQVDDHANQASFGAEFAARYPCRHPLKHWMQPKGSVSDTVICSLFALSVSEIVLDSTREDTAKLATEVEAAPAR